MSVEPGSRWFLSLSLSLCFDLRKVKYSATDESSLDPLQDCFNNGIRTHLVARFFGAKVEKKRPRSKVRLWPRRSSRSRWASLVETSRRRTNPSGAKRKKETPKEP